MIQIGTLRTFTLKNGQQSKPFFKEIRGLYYETLKKLFDNIEHDIDSHMSKEQQYNLFYTVGHHLEGQRTRTSWQCQDIIPFDLDGIDLDQIDKYPPLVAEACGFDLSKTAIVYSGNGCHILVQVPRFGADDKEYIKEKRLGYKQAFNRIMEACKEAGLPIEKDTTAWDYARVLRVPFTVNKKLKKQEDGSIKEIIKECRLIQNNLQVQDWEIPQVKKVNEALSLKEGSFPTPDHREVIESCNFFKWLKDTPDEVHEPHAYAMLSIAGHFQDDRQAARNLYDTFSSPSISAKPFEEFLEQALTTSGPRTCKGIDDIWGKCSECKHHKKLTSPILIKGPDHIGTEFMGFSLRNTKGKAIRQVEDLRRFYQRETNYINLGELDRVMIFNSTHYAKTNATEIKCFAQAQYLPVSTDEQERKAFLHQVKSYNYKPTEFIHGDEHEGLINLKNGVLDIEANTLMPHAPKYGFMYCLNYDYVEGATCPTWDKMLDNLMVGRKELIDFIEEAMAFTISNMSYTEHQHYFLLTGSGSNGKSTFINILKMMLGEVNTSAIKLDKLVGSEYYMAELEGKLANLVADENPKAFEKNGTDATLLKALTGGDSVTARGIFEKPMKFVNKAKFFYAFNDTPKIDMSSHGDTRRPKIIPFDANLDSNKDLRIDNIYEKIEGELSGILNKLLIAYKRLKKNGFTESKIIDGQVEKIRMEHDTVYEFLHEELDYSINDFVSYTVLYEFFNNDPMYQNEKFPIKMRTFAGRLRKALDTSDTYRTCYTGKRNNKKGLYGLKIKNSSVQSNAAKF